MYETRNEYLQSPVVARQLLLYKNVTMYSEDAINSMVAFLTSGLRNGSSCIFVIGLYLKSSGTRNTNKGETEIEFFRESSQSHALLTVIRSKTQIALPMSIVHKIDERINVRATGSTSNNGTALNHR